MATVDVLDSFEAFLALEAEWRELFAAAVAPHSCLRHSWLRLGWELAGMDAGRRFRAVLVREGGELMMAGVFALGWRRYTPTTWFLGSTMPQYNDVLWKASPDTARHAEMLLRALRGGLLPRRLRIERMPAGSPFLAALRSAGRRGRTVAPAPAAIIRTDEHDGFGGYQAGLSQGLRDDHGRRLRRLAEIPGFRLGPERGEGATQALGWMLDTKREWLAHKQKAARWLSGGLVDRFMLELIESGDAPEVMVFTLRLGELAAAALVTIERGNAVLLHVAHDPAYEKHSPGRTICLELVRLVFERGLAELDLGQVNAWKRRFRPSYRDVIDEYLWI
jgi:CelD/BcsL family acetyltransferase involved in cellulose biosynthesis